MRSNFVDIVGYQFEKVHTGAIKWLLDSSNELIDHNEKSNVLRNLYKMCGILPPFKSSDIDFIECKPEFSIGSGKRVDLVIEITLNNGDLKYIVIEMKVDTIAKKRPTYCNLRWFSQQRRCYIYSFPVWIFSNLSDSKT
ncbi:PD-(D/E)XK nuclease family protein [Bacillus cereus]